MLKQLLAIAAVLIVVTIIVAFTPALAARAVSTTEKVPMIGVISVEMGNGPFVSSESFHIHVGKSAVERTGSAINLSFASKLVSPINDTISFNDSIHLSKNRMTETFPVANGTYRLVVPPQQSYQNRIAIEGNSSYSYLTIVESLPTQDIMVNGAYANGSQQLQTSDMYNLTMDYGNISFTLHSPGLLYVNGALFQVSLSINTAGTGGKSLLSFSFPIKDGNFSLVFDQVLSSGQQINNDVMSYYQISPSFQSPWLQDFYSNSISLLIGGVIFIVLLLGLFIYYRKK
ncbi:MAG: hypothetical protein M0Z77_09865 [Thermoplasmatales archaeon]|jgi:hypothetical protein|nr:hypothetical protein [Candidatus Thermoplasmatota archaeon]MDA8055932.1 hypothetical protein [Thermoplasmatales archaeon]